MSQICHMLGSYMFIHSVICLTTDYLHFFLRLFLWQIYSCPLIPHSKNIHFGFNSLEYATHEMIRNGLDIAGT